jgi:hypothetical protein
VLELFTFSSPNLISVRSITLEEDWPTSTHKRATPLVRTGPRAALVYTCIVRERGGGMRDSVKLTGTPLFTNTTFLLLPFIKVSVICCVELLYYIQ